MLQEVWNEKGFIRVNFFPRETTLKSNQYIETPRSLKGYICWVCPTTKVSELLNLHDIRPHTNIPFIKHITDCGWTVLPNKFCSSDLSEHQYIDDEALQNSTSGCSLFTLVVMMTVLWTVHFPLISDSFDMNYVCAGFYLPHLTHISIAWYLITWEYFTFLWPFH